VLLALPLGSNDTAATTHALLRLFGAAVMDRLVELYAAGRSTTRRDVVF